VGRKPQDAGHAPVYLLIEVKVTDPERYWEYVERVLEIVSKRGGQ
jgi:uncharacterized protein (DUF1330 family)